MWQALWDKVDTFWNAVTDSIQMSSHSKQPQRCSLSKSKSWLRLLKSRPVSLYLKLIQVASQVFITDLVPSQGNQLKIPGCFVSTCRSLKITLLKQFHSRGLRNKHPGMQMSHVSCFMSTAARESVSKAEKIQACVYRRLWVFPLVSLFPLVYVWEHSWCL